MAIETAEDDTLWFSLDPDDGTFEEPLTGVTLMFWSEENEQAYFGHIDEDDEVWLYNVEEEDIEVTDWADVNLDE